MPVSRCEETSLELSVAERHSSHSDARLASRSIRLRKKPSTGSDGTLCEKLHNNPSHGLSRMETAQRGSSLQITVAQ